MGLLHRYIHGETTSVYNELYALGADALSPANFTETSLVLHETFTRVRYNLEVIYKELQRINYQFEADIKHDWQIPLLAPDTDTDILLAELKSRVKNVGHIPLSLEYFYTIVGSCNFCWDWKLKPDIPWEGADPVDIPPIKNLLEMVDEEDFIESDCDEILIAGDYLQKDNISGSSYHIQLTTSASLDSLITGWDIPFIEYLRLTCNNCGFTMADQCEYDSLTEFCNRVRPKLLDI